MSQNMNLLGEVLVGQMKRTSSAAVRTYVELGTIQGNLSLTTDSLPAQIPKGDYMVNLMLTSSSRTTETDDHSHELPDGYRSLKGGDRVLVAWCGNEPVVIAVVVSS